MKSLRRITDRLSMVIFGGATATLAVAANLEDPQAIVLAARQEAAAAAQVEVSAVRLAAAFTPEQLHLPRCTTALMARSRQTPWPGTRQSLEVLCTTPPWRVFVPVVIEGTRRVVVLARPRPAGSILSNDDLASADRPGGTVEDGAFRSAEEVVGTRLLRNLEAGQVIVPGIVRRPPAVRRGHPVDVFARTASVTVRTRGVAVADAMVAEHVKVRNPSSGREFEGIVKGVDSVEIRLD